MGVFFPSHSYVCIYSCIDFVLYFLSLFHSYYYTYITLHCLCPGFSNILQPGSPLTVEWSPVQIYEHNPTTQTHYLDSLFYVTHIASCIIIICLFIGARELYIKLWIKFTQFNWLDKQANIYTGTFTPKVVRALKFGLAVLSKKWWSSRILCDVDETGSDKFSQNALSWNFI